MRTLTLVILLGAVASCHAEGPVSTAPGGSLDGGPADIGGTTPSIGISVADGVTIVPADSGIGRGNGDTALGPAMADSGLDGPGLDGNQGDADAAGDAQLPDGASPDAASEVPDAGAGPVGFFPPFSRASACPELPRRCGRLGPHAPVFDFQGPMVPGRWVPESVRVTDQGTVVVRSAWIHAMYCLDSRADVLPTGWISVEVDPATLSASVVDFVADEPDYRNAGAPIQPTDDGTATGWFYRTLTEKLVTTPGDDPGEPAWIHEAKVGGVEVHTHYRSVELAHPEAALTGGITVTKGGVVTVLEVSLSVCQTTDVQLRRSSCVCGDDAAPEVLPDEIPEGADFVTFELDGEVVSIVADGAASLEGSCCSADYFESRGWLPTLHISLSAWPPNLEGSNWRTLELAFPVAPVKEPSFWTAETAGAAGKLGFLFHDGTEPQGATMAAYDFYTSSPLYAFNQSLGGHQALWFNVRLTHLDGSRIEGEFEGLVAPALYWEELATVQVAPAVPLTNGRFRVTNTKYAPVP